MTNKDALEILTHNWTKLVNPDCTDKELGQAQDLAIKALEERPTGEWIPIPLKTLNGDDIVAYESSCCRAIADKKYQHCPKCNEKMEEADNETN